MGNLPARVTGRYQSYDINTPSHATPPMTLRRIQNDNNASSNQNNFQHFQQQQQQQSSPPPQLQSQSQPKSPRQQEDRNLESPTLPNPNSVAATTYMQEEEEAKVEVKNHEADRMDHDMHDDDEDHHDREDEKDLHDDEDEDDGSVKLNKSIDAGNHSFGPEDDQIKQNRTSYADSKIDTDEDDDPPDFPNDGPKQIRESRLMETNVVNIY